MAHTLQEYFQAHMAPALEQNSSESDYDFEAASLESSMMEADLAGLCAATSTLESLHLAMESILTLPRTQAVPAMHALQSAVRVQLVQLGVEDVLAMERIDVDVAGGLQQVGHATMSLIKKLIAFIGQMIIKVSQFIKSIWVGLTADLNKSLAAVETARDVVKKAPAANTYAVILSERTVGILGKNAINLSKYQHDGIAAASDFKTMQTLINGALEHATQLTEATHQTYLDDLMSRIQKLHFTGFETTHTGNKTQLIAKAKVSGVKQNELSFTAPVAVTGSRNWPGVVEFTDFINASVVVQGTGSNGQNTTAPTPTTLSTSDFNATLGAMENFLKACLVWTREFKSVFDAISDSNEALREKFETEAKRVETGLGSSDDAAAQEAVRANAENYQRLIYVQAVNQLSNRYGSFFKDHGQTLGAIATACRSFANTTVSTIKQSAKTSATEASQSKHGF